MDLGYWITWYDLPQAGQDDYLAWLHESYMPAMQASTGALWAAHYASVPKGSVRFRSSGHRPETSDPGVPRGDRYILMFGARNAHAFGNPTPTEAHASLSPTDRTMLAMRIGERVNIMTEVARVHGPEAAAIATVTGPRRGYSSAAFNARVKAKKKRSHNAMAHAGDDETAGVREDAHARLRRRLGEARDPLRVRVSGRAQPLRGSARGRRRESRVDRQGVQSFHAGARLIERRQAAVAATLGRREPS